MNRKITQVDSKAGKLRTKTNIHDDVQGLKDNAPKAPPVDVPGNVGFPQTKRTDHSGRDKEDGLRSEKGCEDSLNQNDVLAALLELGGQARTLEIRDVLVSRGICGDFVSNASVVGARLQDLERWKQVKHVAPGIWEVSKDTFYSGEISEGIA